MVLEAARKGKLVVQVVRTKHVLGEPLAAVLESSLKVGAVESKTAATMLEGLSSTVKTPKSGTTRTVAGGAKSTTTTIAKVGKAAGVAGAVVDGGFRVASAVETERKFQRGEISNEERVTAHAKNAAG
jgi:hypothetical protein